MLTASVGLVLILLFVSAVISAARTAAFHVGPSRIRTLREEGFTGADQLGAVRDKEALVQWSVRLSTRALNLSALGIGVVTGAFTGGLGGTVTNVAVGVVVVILFADIIPHALAVRSPVRLSLAAAPGLLTLTRLTGVLSLPIARLGDALTGEREEGTSEERELREIQAIGQEEGILEESENLLVERAFRLDELTAWDVMVPRVDIFAWKDDLTLGEIHDELHEVPHSRIPVHGGSLDEVNGIVFVREAYERLARGQRDIRLSEISRVPIFVPGTLSCAQLLRDFQSARVHMVIVADEFGGTDGLVTLEDVLEELVGEIHDETDVAALEIVRVSETELDCEAGVDLREIDEALGVELPKEEHRSLNGLILEELGHVPEEGAHFETHGVRVDILEATETQVVRARVTKLPSIAPID